MSNSDYSDSSDYSDEDNISEQSIIISNFSRCAGFDVSRAKDIFSLPEQLRISIDDVEYGTPFTNDIIDNCKQSIFGKGAEEILDLEYRNSYYSDNFHILSDRYHEELENIKRRINNFIFGKVTLIQDKLNIYLEDGFFNNHVDTPKERMIGTLVVCLPNKFKWGAFEITGEKLNWGEYSGKNMYQWCFFYSDLIHKVNRVASGIRATVTYSVMVKEKCDVLSTNLYSCTQDIINISKKYDHIIFKLKYLYCYIAEDLLKGFDAQLFHTLKMLKLNPRIILGIYPGGNYGRYCSICKDELGDYEFTLSNKFRDVDYCEDCCFSDTADIKELYFYEGPPKGGYAHTCEHGEDSYALDEHYLIKYDNFIYFDPTGDPILTRPVILEMLIHFTTHLFMGTIQHLLANSTNRDLLLLKTNKMVIKW